MLQLQRGQRTPLARILQTNTVEVQVHLDGDAPSYDVTCLLQGEDERVLSDAHAVSAGQPRSPDGAVTYAAGAGGRDAARFAVALMRLDHRARKLSFAVSADGGELRGVRAGRVELHADGVVVASYAFSGADFPTERVIIALELYVRGGEWRVHACGQGFAGGMAALGAHVGLRAVRAAPAPAPGVIGGHWLRGQGDQTWVPTDMRAVEVQLEWDRAWRNWTGGAAELELGCMLELEDGHRSVIHTLGGFPGRPGDYPYVHLKPGDPTRLVLARPARVTRLLVFVLLRDGAGSFRDLGARLRVIFGDGQEVALALDEASSTAAFCAAALLERRGETLGVRKEERYFGDHRDCDEVYGFGFRWRDD